MHPPLKPDAKPRGLLVFLHGYASDADYVRQAAGPFVAAGFLVLTPEAPDHGTRVRAEGFPLDDWSALATHAAEVGARWVEELSKALPAWRVQYGLPLYAAGFSMGAYIWHELISRRLARPVAAALFGMGAIPNVPLPEGVENPLARAEAYPPTALLQVHGAADDVVPVETVRRTIEALQLHYAGHPGKLGLFITEHLGHELGPGMAEAAAAWLAAWRPDA